MMGIFDFLKRRNHDDIIPDKKVKRTRNLSAIAIINNDLNRLNDIKPGLGTKAVSYVLLGKHETVLSTLATGNYHELLEIGRSYVQLKTTHKRHNLFSQMKPYDVELIARYAQILTAAAPSNLKPLSGSK